MNVGSSACLYPSENIPSAHTESTEVKKKKKNVTHRKRSGKNAQTESAEVERERKREKKKERIGSRVESGGKDRGIVNCNLEIKIGLQERQEVASLGLPSTLSGGGSWARE